MTMSKYINVNAVMEGPLSPQKYIIKTLTYDGEYSYKLRQTQTLYCDVGIGENFFVRLSSTNNVMSYDSPLKGVNLSFFFAKTKKRKEKTERRSKTVIHTSNHIFGTLISVSKLFCEKLFTYWQWTTFKGGRGGRAGRV